MKSAFATDNDISLMLTIYPKRIQEICLVLCKYTAFDKGDFIYIHGK